MDFLDKNEDFEAEISEFKNELNQIENQKNVVYRPIRIQDSAVTCSANK